MAFDNVLKNFDFALELDGVIQAGLQGVTPPPIELTEHKQGTAGNNPDVKTPGKKKVGDLVCESVVRIEGADTDIWVWLESGRTGLRPAYTKTGFLLELTNGIPVARYLILNTWCKKIESAQYDNREDNSADLLRTVTFSVEDYVKVG